MKLLEFKSPSITKTQKVLMRVYRISLLTICYDLGGARYNVDNVIDLIEEIFHYATYDRENNLYRVLNEFNGNPTCTFEDVCDFVIQKLIDCNLIDAK